MMNNKLKKSLSGVLVFLMFFSMVSPAFAGRIDSTWTTGLVPDSAIPLTSTDVGDPSVLDVFLDSSQGERRFSDFFDFTSGDDFYFNPGSYGRFYRDRGGSSNLKRAHLEHNYIGDIADLSTTGFTSRTDMGDLSFVNSLLSHIPDTQLIIQGSGHLHTGEVAAKWTSFEGLEALTNLTNLDFRADEFPHIFNLAPVAELGSLKKLYIQAREDQFIPHFSKNSGYHITQPIEDLKIWGTKAKSISDIYSIIKGLATEEGSVLKKLTTWGFRYNVPDLTFLTPDSVLEEVDLTDLSLVSSLKNDGLPSTLKTLKLSTSNPHGRIAVRNFKDLGVLPPSLTTLILGQAQISTDTFNTFRAENPGVTVSLGTQHSPLATQEKEGSFNVSATGIQSGTPTSNYTIPCPTSNPEGEYEITHDVDGVPTVKGDVTFSEILGMYDPHDVAFIPSDVDPYWEPKYTPLTGYMVLDISSATNGTGLGANVKLKRLGDSTVMNLKANGSGRLEQFGLLFGEYEMVIYNQEGKYEPQTHRFTLTVDQRNLNQAYSLVYNEDITKDDVPALTSDAPSQSYENVQIFIDGVEITPNDPYEVNWTTAIQGKTIEFKYEGWTISRSMRVGYIPNVNVTVEHVTPGGRLLGTETRTNLKLFSNATITTTRTYTGYDRSSSSLTTYLPNENHIVQFVHVPSFTVKIRHMIQDTSTVLGEYDYTATELIPYQSNMIDYDGTTYDGYLISTLQTNVYPYGNATSYAFFYHTPDHTDVTVLYKRTGTETILDSETVSAKIGEDNIITNTKTIDGYTADEPLTQTVKPLTFGEYLTTTFWFTPKPYIDVTFILEDETYTYPEIYTTRITEGLTFPGYNTVDPTTFMTEPEFTGYMLKYSAPQNVNLDHPPYGSVSFYVVPEVKGSVTVEHYDALTYDLLDSEVFSDITLNTPYDVNAKSFSGYTLTSPTTQTVTLTSGQPNQTVYFYYTPPHANVTIEGRKQSDNSLLNTIVWGPIPLNVPTTIWNPGGYPGLQVTEANKIVTATTDGENITVTFYYAEPTHGSVYATVLDSSWLPISANVKFEGTTNFDDTTDTWGNYMNDSVPFGTYTVTYYANGYLPETRTFTINASNPNYGDFIQLLADPDPTTASGVLTIENRNQDTDALISTTTLNLAINELHTITPQGIPGYKHLSPVNHQVLFDYKDEAKTVTFYYEPIISGDMQITVKDINNNPLTANVSYNKSGDAPTLKTAVGSLTELGIPFGDYTITISKEGYLPQTDSFTTNLATPNFVKDYTLLVDPDSLPPVPTTGDLQVVVIDTDGNPLTANVSYNKSGDVPTNKATTGGTLTETGLPFGNYTITVSKEGFISQVQTRTLDVTTPVQTLLFTLTSSGGTPPSDGGSTKPPTDGGSTQPPVPPAIPVKTGFIAVNIKHPVTKKPLSDIEVMLLGTGVIRQGTTDKFGKLLFNGLVWGESHFIVTKIGDDCQLTVLIAE
jgi:hypothetical protein